MAESTVTPLMLPDPAPIHGPRVSLLVTSYNYGRYIGNTLQSAKDQTYQDMEVIVLDNCSTDDSFDIIQSVAGDDTRFSLHRNDSTLGPLDSFRQCFSLANGEFAQILNADDRLVDPQAIAKLVAALQSDPDITIATSRRQLIDEQGNAYVDTVLTTPLSDVDVVFAGELFGNVILGKLVNKVSESSTMFRRKLLPVDEHFYSIGGHGPLYYYIDVAWWLRLCAAGKVAYLAETLGQYRIHSLQGGMGKSGDPRAMTDWFTLIAGAKGLGFLSDPTTERSCLFSLAVFIAELLPGYVRDLSSYDPEKTATFMELTARIAALEQRIKTLTGEIETADTT